MLCKLTSTFACLFVFAFTVCKTNAQTYTGEIEQFQEQLNEEYKDPEESPLEKKMRRQFKGHDFYPIDSTYRVTAHYIKIENGEDFAMQTSTQTPRAYQKYAMAIFTLHGVQDTLYLYQSHRLREKAAYKKYLFLPFTDLTNGSETYGGGRYIDLQIPDANVIIIDFNKAYNPYCAYSHSYSCPIPPTENFINHKITAGIRLSAKED